jgi:uroporphyrinogen decarboxylase
MAEIGFVPAILQRLRTELSHHPEVAVIGFAGAPWTLAAYMVEGGVSRNYTRIKTMMWDDPALLHRLMDRIAQTIILYLNAQIAAGAQVVQLFDSWAGILAEREYRTFVLPYQQQVIDGLNRVETPVILYVNGSRGLLNAMAETGTDVISVDWLTSLTEARRQVGGHIALQGNLDPNALFSHPDVLTPMVHAMLNEGGSTGYVANLGHGILPTTPPENVRLLVDIVKHTATAMATRG